MIAAYGLSDPKQLWENNQEILTEDILLQVGRENPGTEVQYTPAIFNKALTLLDDKVLSMVDTKLKVYGLPAPSRPIEVTLNRDLLREMNYDANQLTSYIAEDEPKLIRDQTTAYRRILAKVDDTNGAIVFLDAPGGTGKTFLSNLLLAKIRQQRNIAIAVASSGIAATLLVGAVHSTLP